MIEAKMPPQAIEAFEKAASELLRQIRANQIQTHVLQSMSLEVSFADSMAKYQIKIEYKEGEASSCTASGYCWSIPVAIQSINEQG